MSRKGQTPKRKILPDPKFKDKTVAKFINKLMWDGKKSAAEKILYQSLDVVKEKTGEDGIKVFKQVLENLKPVLEVRSRRVGGSNYQVPVEVRPERRLALAMNWLITYSRERNEKSMVDCLAAEMVDAFNNRGGSVKKREDVHKMAEANRAFSHFRW